MLLFDLQPHYFNKLGTHCTLNVALVSLWSCMQSYKTLVFMFHSSVAASVFRPRGSELSETWRSLSTIFSRRFEKIVKPLFSKVKFTKNIVHVWLCDYILVCLTSKNKDLRPSETSVNNHVTLRHSLTSSRQQHWRDDIKTSSLLLLLDSNC
jgi:hypothetical protein